MPNKITWMKKSHLTISTCLLSLFVLSNTTSVLSTELTGVQSQALLARAFNPKAADSCAYPRRPMSMLQFKYLYTRQRYKIEIENVTTEYYIKDPQKSEDAFDDTALNSIEAKIRLANQSIKIPPFYSLERQVKIDLRPLFEQFRQPDGLLQYPVPTSSGDRKLFAKSFFIDSKTSPEVPFDEQAEDFLTYLSNISEASGVLNQQGQFIPPIPFLVYITPADTQINFFISARATIPENLSANGGKKKPKFVALYQAFACYPSELEYPGSLTKKDKMVVGEPVLLNEEVLDRYVILFPSNIKQIKLINGLPQGIDPKWNMPYNVICDNRNIVFNNCKILP